MKKILSLLLMMGLALATLTMFVPTVEAEAATSLTESEFATKIEALKLRYPDGQYWNEKNGTETIAGKTVAKAGTSACTGTRTDSAHYGQKCTSVGFCSYCTCNCGQFYGWQCFGFANLMAYHIFGSYGIKDDAAKYINSSAGWKYLTSVSTFYAGDIVRINGSHSIFVYKVVDSQVYYVECNNGVPCQINWDGKKSVSSLKSSMTYVARMDGNTLKGTGEPAGSLTIQYHANGGTIADPVAIGTNYEVYTTDGSHAYARSGPSGDYSIVTSFASGSVVTVTETKQQSDYTWGKIKYNGSDAWMALGDWMVPSGTAYDPPYYLSSSVVYDRNTSQPTSQVIAYGQEIQDGLYNNTTFKLHRDGYNFLGWSLVADGSDTVIGQDQTIKPEEIAPEIANGSNVTVTMYAIWEAVECNPHSYTVLNNDLGHWEECTICGDKKPIENHNWELAKLEDGSIIMGSTSHWYECKTCGCMFSEDHIFENDCDTNCDVCQAKRTVPDHQLQIKFDSETHWQECTLCGEQWFSITGHTYNNDCDESCDDCGFVRTVQHSFDRWDVNSNGHWRVCSICGKKGSDIEPHNVPTIDTYIWTYHSGICTICEKYINYKHVYENDCDTSCSECEYERAVQHTYQNDCDSTCDICGQVREVEEHVYGDEYSYDDHGHWNVCSICGEKGPAQAHTVIAHSIMDSVYHKIDCSICKGNIAEKHIFDDNNDKACNDCGYEREIGIVVSKKNLVIGGTVGGVSLLGLVYIFLKKKH